MAQSPGQLLPRTVSVLSNTVSEGRRTVVLRRALHGGERFRSTPLRYWLFTPAELQWQSRGKRGFLQGCNLETPGPETFSFESSVSSIPLINAVGSGPLLSVHKAKGPVTLSLLPGARGRFPSILAVHP